MPHGAMRSSLCGYKPHFVIFLLHNLILIRKGIEEVITSRTRNAVVGFPAHGFESHPFRQRKSHLLGWLFCCVIMGGLIRTHRSALPSQRSGDMSHPFHQPKAQHFSKSACSFTHNKKHPSALLMDVFLLFIQKMIFVAE